MKIKFLGASGTVTGSCYVLTGDSGQSILIDLGMFQGTPAIEKYNYEPFEYDCKLLSGAILTHAHLDHCGRLPILLTYGFSGRIHMTPATRDLTELSLLDSAKIARSDNKEFLYDEELAARTIQKFETVPTAHWNTLFPNALTSGTTARMPVQCATPIILGSNARSAPMVCSICASGARSR